MMLLALPFFRNLADPERLQYFQTTLFRNVVLWQVHRQQRLRANQCWGNVKELVLKVASTQIDVHQTTVEGQELDHALDYRVVLLINDVVGEVEVLKGRVHCQFLPQNFKLFYFKACPR